MMWLLFVLINAQCSSYHASCGHDIFFGKSATESAQRFQNVATRHNLAVPKSQHCLFSCTPSDEEIANQAERIEWTMRVVETYNERDVVRLVDHIDTFACLDSSGEDVFMLHCNGGTFQKWILERLNNSRVQLRNLATLRLLSGGRDRKLSAESYEIGTFTQWYIRDAERD
jgi:hypothetical protein